MDKSKRAGFVAMGKRQKFAKGGLIRKLGNRKYFDTGGPTALSDPSLSLGGPNSGGAFENASNPNTGVLGSIGAAVGLNNNFQATGAKIQPGTNAAQLDKSYKDTQAALGQQGNLVNTLTPQAESAVGNQNALAQQLYGMTQGQGPNPALAQLAQATQQNVSNQNALMAGQRGASGNVGLMARQAAQRGAGTQQEAVGQGATMQAQQQIAAQQSLANLASNQISQTGQATTGLNSAQQGEQAILQNANTSANNAAVGMQSNINNVNSQTSAANQNMAANIAGGIMGGASSMMSAFGMSKGGVVRPHHVTLAEMNAASLKHAIKNFDEGGEISEVGKETGESIGGDLGASVQAPAESAPADLGSFKSASDAASAPNIGATATLPADQTNLADAASGKGGGGGGGGGGMAMLAMLDKGGPISANPLTAASPYSQSNLGSVHSSPQSASSGPNIQATGALPANTESFSKDVEGMKDKDKTKETKPETKPQTSSHFTEYFSEGGGVKAMVSPGEIYLNPRQVEKVLKEGVDPARIGKKYKGKAKVKGDSLKNDVIPDTLEEGGVVIDRKNMSTREKRELFVHRTMARKKARG